jgi:outer membrane lipase/esterase
MACFFCCIQPGELQMPVKHRSYRAVRNLLAAALAFAALPAAAQTYTQTVFFGDSLTDSGWFRPTLVQLAGPSANGIGRFSTNPTLNWADYVAAYYGGNSTSANQGGLNYAVGGASTGTDGSATLAPGVTVPVPSLATQITSYLAANGGHADRNALYTVWGGANDLFAITAGADPATTMAGAVGAQIGNVATLNGAGARYIIVSTVPDLGLTPAFRAQGPLAQAQGTQLSMAYNTALFNGLATSGLRVIPLDTFTLLREIVANPATYGIANVTGTACQPQITAQSLTCNPGTYVAPNASETYAFADGVHPSTAAHRILGQFALSVLEAPRQIEVLAQSEALVGRGRAEVVSGHLAAKPDGDGMRWWADVRGDNQRYGDPVHYDGGGPSLTFGVDWSSGNVVYGAFAGYGRQSIDYGLRRGEFKQSDATLGGFVGWHGDAFWANGQASWTKTSYDVDRDVHLGPATRRHSGSPDGDNLSVGANAGWDFSHGALTHGPVVSLLMQKIGVDGYAENSTESTALAYPEQDFDSLIGSAGWQASYVISDNVAPYARLTWDHEFEDAPEEAFAQSRSLPGTLPYAVPGLELDENYGTLLLGVRTRVLGLDANIGASATVGQQVGDHASVFVTVGNRF